MIYDPNHPSTGPFTVRKWNGRLYIVADNTLVYSPPDHIKLHSRTPLYKLAEQATNQQSLSIDLRIQFEAEHRKRKVRI